MLHLRGLYPPTIFVKRKKYRIPVMMSEHPWVKYSCTSTKNYLSFSLILWYCPVFGIRDILVRIWMLIWILDLYL